MKKQQTITKKTDKNKLDQNHNPTKIDINKSYNKTLLDVQSQLSIPSKILSKIIHTPPIEQISNILSSTLFRPYLIIAGAIGAISSIIVYFIARKYGYTLSGGETILLFTIGWTIGALIEYIRVGFFSKSR